MSKLAETFWPEVIHSIFGKNNHRNNPKSAPQNPPAPR